VDRKPLILVSRSTVVTAVSDISITIGKRNVPARPLYLGLFAILTVDSGLLPAAITIPNVSTKEYMVGDSVDVFGFLGDHQLVQKRTEICAIVPVSPTIEAYGLVDAPPNVNGILLDPTDSSLVAFWIPGLLGINCHYYIQPIVETLRAGKVVEMWDSGCGFGKLHLAGAIDLGVPEHHATRISAIARSIGTGPQTFCVCEKEQLSDSEFELGDLILEIDDQPVGRMADIRVLSRAEFNKVLVLRDHNEVELIVKSKLVPPESFNTVICWGGAMLQVPNRAMLTEITAEFVLAANKEGIQVTDFGNLIYIWSRLPGSPASAFYGLAPFQWLLEVNKQKVSSMEVLLKIITTLEEKDDEEYVPVKVISKVGTVSTAGIKLNSQFWPCWLLEWQGTKWVRAELK
jgi:hypothetical protein